MKQVLNNLHNLSSEDKRELLSLLEELESAKLRESCESKFLSFVNAIWAAFIHGKHHEIMGEAFERVANGELKRLIINMPLDIRSQSLLLIFYLPGFLGRYPDKKIIQTAHTAELAVGFGRKVRNLVNSSDFKTIFPNVSLQADSKAAGRWNTNKGGEYFAIGVGGAVTGKGADLLIIDDPHSEQEGASSDINVFNKTYEWYTSGPRQRLQPKGSIVVVMTRWHDKDLTGQLVDASIKRGGADQWEVIELPALLPSGNPLWSEFWKLEELEALRAELPTSKWMAQYQQDPTAEEGAIV